jgi:alpha-glucosidase
VAADGWRLDVIHMLGEGAGAHNNAQHARAIRRAIKEENPEAYVLGEHFAEATRWLQGDQEDGAMNYHGFAMPVWGWLANDDDPARLSTADYDAWLVRARASIGHETQLAQLNLLGSHDTMRIFTRFASDLARVKLAMTLLFSHAGVPSLYYGDELGMEGGPDPDCRRCMDWSGESWQRSLLQHVHALAALRRERSEWRHGAQLTLAAGEHWIAHARFTGDAASVVCVNRGDPVDASVPLAALPLQPARWRVEAEHRLQGGVLRLRLPARESVVALGDA